MDAAIVGHPARRSITIRGTRLAQDDDLTQVWGRVVATLESSPDITAREVAFVRLARPLGMLDGTVLLAVGNDFTKEYLESRVRAAMSEALTDALGRDTRFAVTVDPGVADELPTPIAPIEAPRATLTLVPPVADSRADVAAQLTRRPRSPIVEPARLHPRYVFETFVIGSSNRFACHSERNQESLSAENEALRRRARSSG